ncbi:hypothetical protein M0805_005765 [Coniferiporia weirii]|nr:hypothetical protein M0805_005765 [Coniferiporia weirii]
MADAETSCSAADAFNATPDAIAVPTSTVDATADVSAHEASRDTSAAGSSNAQPLSKKAQKRIAKAASFAEKKMERRAREKAMRKEKKREKRERAEAGEEDEDDEPQKKKAKHPGPVHPFDAKIVVDLGFDEMMSEKEISSLSSQLAYTYSANRRATCPFSSLLFTSVNGRLRARLDGENDAGYRRWTNTEWWEDGYECLWTEGADASKETLGNKEKTRGEKEKVVYLTADASDELEELKEGEIYIIGGIVDRNRYKNLCQNKAVGSGLRTARLPIGKYLAEMTTRKVLTVNQVFEILVHWTESRNWEEAMYSVMPKRKFVQSSTNQPTVADLEDSDGREDNADNTPATEPSEDASTAIKVNGDDV